MDRTRKANREGDEATLQYRTPNEALHEALQIEEKLSQLQAAAVQLKQTTSGLEEFQRRIALFGECNQLAGESSSQFCNRLCIWLERALPPKKSPRHPPRQNE